MDEYISIGKLVGVFALKGELVLQHSLGNADLKGVKAIFTQMQGNTTYMPWFIESSKIKNATEVLIKIEGVNTPEEAKKLIQKKVWLKKTDFNKSVSKSSPVSLLGFKIINEKEVLGEIIEIFEQPQQVLCTVIVNNKEVFIPLHNETLQKIDRKKREVHVILPNGLLDLYLQ